ncbi:hypothetical protein BIW11_03014 [Tropilaelaps mercedesae]|uniref:Immunoglobulin I-set domain-containing protein n=1 Tax=Tropilaelaps mercedesae TaxID=418985 RepID=A0A1V9XTH8_9ACAR|nr:hypothetical protein BIW11_03014 [Tropilaelaps mercedesae]
MSGQPIDDYSAPSSSNIGIHQLARSLDFGLCTLEIYNAKNTDTGEYSVIAKNKFGHCTTSAYLRVTGGREQSPERPMIWRATEDVQVAPGAEAAELRWRVTGWPLPSVHAFPQIALPWLVRPIGAASYVELIVDVEHPPPKAAPSERQLPHAFYSAAFAVAADHCHMAAERRHT